MAKKKIGELEGTPIVTGEKNYANEHEYYLTMNEDNTYQKLELRVSGDLFRTVLGGDNSGCSCGIPTIDKNIQPNLVRRDATYEDKAKFTTSPIISVVDIQDGKLPLFIINSLLISGESITIGKPLTSVTFPTEDEDGSVMYGDADAGMRFYISRDWSLLGVQGIA